MPVFGQVKISYQAVDGDGVGIAGDGANHLLEVLADDIESPAENAPVDQGAGWYGLTLTAAENAGEFMVVRGVSTTPGVTIIPARWQNQVAAVPVTPAPPATTLADAILANATGPKSASGDTGSVEQHSLKDQIEAARYLAGHSAVGNPRRGVRFTKIVPPGSE